MNVRPMRFTRCRACVLAGLAASALLSTAAQAQRDSLPWVTRRNAIAATAAVGATLLLVPFDRSISSEFAEPTWARGRMDRRVADHVAMLGGSDPLVVSSAFYVAAEALGFPGAAQLGLRTTESIVLAGGLAGLVRGVTGRALPGVRSEEEFSFGRGFHDRNGPYVSFPSGHTASAAAITAVLSGELRRAHPRIARFVTPAAYALAASVGVARVAQRAHWPSDLPLALFIGTWSGQAVETHLVRDSTPPTR